MKSASQEELLFDGSNIEKLDYKLDKIQFSPRNDEKIINIDFKRKSFVNSNQMPPLIFQNQNLKPRHEIQKIDNILIDDAIQKGG